MRKFPLITILAFLAMIIAMKSQEPADMKYAETEINRTMDGLKGKQVPPYFLSYSITEAETNSITASFGKIRSKDSDKKKILDIDIRVGNYKFDNTHIIRGNPFSFSTGLGTIELPLDDNERGVRNAMWFATDKLYKSAVERFEKAQTNQAVKVAEEDTSADLSFEKPSIYFEPKKSIVLDMAKWEQMLARLSAKFDNISWLYDGDVSFSSFVKHKMFISSEGSKVSLYETNCRIFVNAKTKSDDGMSLPLYKSYFAFGPEGLPDEKTISEDIDKLIALLDRLRKAPLASTYTGPAILSGEAAGVFFHEIFGHRIEGHREKDPNSSQTFKQSVDTKILPDFISVANDPTMNKIGGREISGYYEYDDEGVKSQRVVNVDGGVLKNFLMSRSPIEKFPKSNGHGRKQEGYNAVSRQSNLIVDAKNKVSTKELKEKLIAFAKEQGKEYGLYFDIVSGGFTFTSRTIPNAFNVTPLVVYKVFVDGRPDELVRGVDLIGTPLTTFQNIVAAADDLGIFNGICGAESGGVPVSACSPSLLVSTIEVQKKQKSQAKPPILPFPYVLKVE